MCDFFSQSWAETTHHDGGGDLADIVRASGVSGPSAIDPASAGTPDPSWQYLLLQNDHQPAAAAAAAAFPPPLAVDSSTTRHASSFGGLRGPALLHELGGGALRASPLSPVAEDHGRGVQQIQSPRIAAGGIKRRKSQAKKVVCIPAAPAAGAASHGRSSSGEVVPSDLWAWRKYGQKPIKGSPYPRGYYRCSSSKGCSARKQVERSRTDPNMLVITYTSEHNHPWPTQRNALAGSTRSLQASRRTSAAAATTTGSSVGIVKEEEEEEEEESSVGDTEKDEAFDRMFYCNVNEPAMDESDDFFAGLAELDYEQMSLMYD